MVQQRLEPRRESDERAEAEKQQPAHDAHARIGPDGSERRHADRDGLLLRRAGAATAELRAEHQRREHRERRLDDKQRGDLLASERCPQYERKQHPAEDPRRADRNAVGAQRRGQVLRRDLRHRVQHERLRDGDQDLPGKRPGVVVAGEPDEATGGGEHGSDREPAMKGAVEQTPRWYRQHHVEQREELREPADRRFRDSVMVR